jgi:hypothetical protein
LVRETTLGRMTLIDSRREYFDMAKLSPGMMLGLEKLMVRMGQVYGTGNCTLLASVYIALCCALLLGTYVPTSENPPDPLVSRVPNCP